MEVIEGVRVVGVVVILVVVAGVVVWLTSYLY